MLVVVDDNEGGGLTCHFEGKDDVRDSVANVE
jgi:hypothetical protein